jgi:hypothetical protein
VLTFDVAADDDAGRISELPLRLQIALSNTAQPVPSRASVITTAGGMGQSKA